jgi:hypothetical protein
MLDHPRQVNALPNPDPEYQRRLRRRIIEGKEAPQLVVRLLEYGYGKPKETVEHQGSRNVIGD